MITDPAYSHVMQLLQDGSLGTIGVDIFGAEWGQVDKQTLVMTGVSTPSELKREFEEAGIQVICRGKKPGEDSFRDIDVYRTIKTITDFLLSQPDHIEIDGVCYSGFEPSSSIAPLGKDDNERFMYSMNFTTFRNAF